MQVGVEKCEIIDISVDGCVDGSEHKTKLNLFNIVRPHRRHHHLTILL